MTTATLSLWTSLLVCVIILLFAFLVLGKLWKGTISLDGLLSEPESNKASLSRFQFLVFTFVIAGLFLLLSVEAGTFVDIPNNVLALLGISSGSYLVSKSVAPGGALSRSPAKAPQKFGKG